MVIINRLYVFVVFFYLMWGATAWFTWFLEDPINKYIKWGILLLGFIISLIYAHLNKIKITIRNRNMLIGIILFIFAYFLRSPSAFFLISSLLMYFPLLILLEDKRNVDRILNVICKLLAGLLTVGLMMHIFSIIYGLFPTLPIQHPLHSYYIFWNYFVVLKGINYEAEGLRFHSVFSEPGYLGTMLSFLLYAVRFNFKKTSNIILLISLILSFSLAGYITTFIGYIIYNWSVGLKVKRITIIFTVLVISYFYIVNYNNGRNLIKEKIVDRLEIDRDKGIIGNNRVGDATDVYFERILNNGEFILGVGNEKINKYNGGDVENYADLENSVGGAGYKVFIIRYGLVSAIMFLFAYVLLGPLRKEIIQYRKYMYGFLSLIVLTFIQSSQPQSFSWLIPYILGAMSMERTFTEKAMDSI